MRGIYAVIADTNELGEIGFDLLQNVNLKNLI